MPEIPDKRLPGLVPGSSGRRMGLALHLHRHPGLAPGSTQTGRDLKTTTAGCFQDPEYRWGDFGTTDGGVLQPIRHPGLAPGPRLAPGPNKKAVISKQPLPDVF